MESSFYHAINWNNVEDFIDQQVWQKLVAQFWVDTRIPVSNDLDDWRTLSLEEKDLISKVFGGLTLLDTLQSEQGAPMLKKDAITQMEQAVFANIEFMEAVHAKSYSTIFSTLNTKAEIEEIFNWVHNNTALQNKARIVNEIYQSEDPIKKKIVSVFLESFLFYSGFYTPLRYLGQNKMTNVAEIIKLILRDESVHGTYIGYKFQKNLEQVPEDKQQEYIDWAYGLLYELYENELVYTEELYGPLRWTEDVAVFLRYNANKALMNLGLDPLFPDKAEDVNPIVMNGISTGTSNHDFFSQVGNGYLVGDVEPMSNEDYFQFTK